MKKLIIIATILMLALPLSAQNWNKNLEVEASELNLVGKAFYDTPNPYHRIDNADGDSYRSYRGFDLYIKKGREMALGRNDRFSRQPQKQGSHPQNCQRYGSRGKGMSSLSPDLH